MIPLLFAAKAIAVGVGISAAKKVVTGHAPGLGCAEGLSASACDSVMEHVKERENSGSNSSWFGVGENKQAEEKKEDSWW